MESLCTSVYVRLSRCFEAESLVYIMLYFNMFQVHSATSGRFTPQLLELTGKIFGADGMMLKIIVNFGGSNHI